MTQAEFIEIADKHLVDPGVALEILDKENDPLLITKEDFDRILGEQI